METLLICGTIANFLNWIITLITRYFSKKDYQKVAHISDDYKYLKISATELAEKIRNMEISSEEVVKEYIKRIKEVNPLINAVLEERFDKATEEAIAADKYIKAHQNEDLKTQKPLLGLPITIKESCVVKSMSLTGCSLLRKGIRATDDSVTVKKIKEAGAIILLVSATPEYCVTIETNTLLNGTTRNPYNEQKTCGGSSGGEGALLGAGASLIGIGSDIAGSIRIPALFNGIFGHKPTRRFVYSEDHFIIPKDKRAGDYLTMGPMTRYAADLRLLMSVLSPKEFATYKMNETILMKNIRVYSMMQSEKSLMVEPVQEEIKEAIHKASRHLQSVGCRIENYKFNLKDSTPMASCVFYDLKGIPNFFQHKEYEDNYYMEVLKSIVGMSKHSFAVLFFKFLLIMDGFVSTSKYAFYNKMAQDLLVVFKEKLGTDGVLLYPTFPTSAFYHNHAPLHIVSTTYAMLFNLLGLPCCNVPMGFDKYGMPIGLQVVAGPNQDRLCFAVAEELERSFGGWKE